MRAPLNQCGSPQTASGAVKKVKSPKAAAVAHAERIIETRAALLYRDRKQAAHCMKIVFFARLRII
jgi:hypothetical protein